ncbi:hypothetical protein CCACVL1_14233 [Corchorus capsularis]|uniref:Uncharacterized protein n=1 Tax=Corchorus capsularis TaxID=210143 RepID=A0A1R3I7W3_COCAP|nr:hypothetical protein CCACVL1_14233 [Corchorus capsularis]
MESDGGVGDVEGEGSADEQEEGVRHSSDDEGAGESSDEINDEGGDEGSHADAEDDALGVSDVEDVGAIVPICNRRVASRATATNTDVLPFLEKYNKKCKSNFSVPGGFCSKYSCNGPNVGTKIKGNRSNHEWKQEFFGIEVDDCSFWGINGEWRAPNTKRANRGGYALTVGEEKLRDALLTNPHSSADLTNPTRLWLCGLSPFPTTMPGVRFSRLEKCGPLQVSAHKKVIVNCRGVEGEKFMKGEGYETIVRSVEELSDGGVPLEIGCAARRHGRGKGLVGLGSLRHVTAIEAAAHPPSEEEHFDDQQDSLGEETMNLAAIQKRRADMRIVPPPTTSAMANQQATIPATIPAARQTAPSALDATQVGGDMIAMSQPVNLSGTPLPFLSGLMGGGGFGEWAKGLSESEQSASLDELMAAFLTHGIKYESSEDLRSAKILRPEELATLGLASAIQNLSIARATFAAYYDEIKDKWPAVITIIEKNLPGLSYPEQMVEQRLKEAYRKERDEAYVELNGVRTDLEDAQHSVAELKKESQVAGLEEKLRLTEEGAANILNVAADSAVFMVKEYKDFDISDVPLKLLKLPSDYVWPPGVVPFDADANLEEEADMQDEEDRTSHSASKKQRTG